MGMGAIFSGSTIKLLKSTLDLFGNAQILSGSVDPTSVATSAPKGSIYLNTSTGLMYQKSDAGSSTNWFTISRVSNFSTDLFSGNGSTTAFTLSATPGSLNNTFVFVDGVYQQKATYSVSGTTLTFTAAPPTGTSNVEINYGSTFSTLVPANGSVTAAMMATNAIATANIQSGAVTKDKLAALGQQISSSSGSISTTSTSYVDATNLTVTITTTGRPVFIGLMPDGAGVSQIGATATGGGNVSVSFKTVRSLGGTPSDVGEFNFAGLYPASAQPSIPSSAVNMVDVPAAGTYTYKLQYKVVLGTASILNAKLIAYEL